MNETNQVDDDSVVAQHNDREPEAGRYTERNEAAHASQSELNGHQVNSYLKEKQSEHADYISKELDQLYASISQHVNDKLTEIEDQNQEIAELLDNLNSQLKTALDK